MTADEFIERYKSKPSESHAKAGDKAASDGDHKLASEHYGKALAIHRDELRDFRELSEDDKQAVVYDGWPYAD